MDCLFHHRSVPSLGGSLKVGLSSPAASMITKQRDAGLSSPAASVSVQPATPRSPNPSPLSDAQKIVYRPKTGIARSLQMDSEALQSPGNSYEPASFAASPISDNSGVIHRISLSEVKQIIADQASGKAGGRPHVMQGNIHRFKESTRASSRASRVSDCGPIHIPCNQWHRHDSAKLPNQTRTHVASDKHEGIGQTLQTDKDTPRKEHTPASSRASEVCDLTPGQTLQTDKANPYNPRKEHTPVSSRASEVCGLTPRGTSNGKTNAALVLKIGRARSVQLPQRPVRLPSSQNPQFPRKENSMLSRKPLIASDHRVMQTRSELASAGEDLSCSSLTKQCGVKLVVFDFDCTLTSFHVFSSLACVVQSTAPRLTVPPPYARSEEGQLERLCELDNDTAWGPGVFALKAFGGHQRLTQLRDLLEVLRQSKVECVILSRGMTKPIRKILEQVNLLSFFSHIHGSEGCSMGRTTYDEKVADEKALSRQSEEPPEKEQSFQMNVMKSKAQKLTAIMKERDLESGQVVFIDDEFQEIERASSTCGVIHVSSGKGMHEEDMQLLLRAIIAQSMPRDQDKKLLGP